MKRILIIVLFLGFSNLNFCQENINKVQYVYKVKNDFISKDLIEKEKKNGLKDNLELINNSIINYQNKMSFNLTFNKFESIFSMNKMLNLDFDKQMIFVMAIIKAKDIIYTDLKNRITLKKIKTLGEEFNVKTNLDSVKWELTQEEKTIGGYRCYKAITKSIFKKGLIIEAWYCPSIPFGFGPKGYGGLPGLILELTENRITFFAKEVKMNINEKFNFEFKEKNKYISQKKLDSLIVHFNKNRFKRN